MKAESGGPVEKPGKEPGSVQQESRTCPVCGTKFFVTADKEFCPVCILRGATGGESTASGESGSVSGPADRPKEINSGPQPQRFEHYEVMLDESGRPIELGRGAMGITYKALDIDLRCLVTLKVISERYLGDESARLRFLREARAAASVRHPNVASVFHLGRTGENYFYAMEFVEGETLESLIRRSVRLEVKLALEIVTQVASGLAAVHKQKLVHRDIKPSNIMVSPDEGSGVTTKIIDLGLAKSLDEPSAQTAISTPGAFAGTPEFASPEQFGGVGVDIRSDLYSLGVVLWEMVTGHVVFRGSPAEVMYQHQHKPLPLEELESVPQPLIVLLEALLEKDPAQRFQNPADLLKVVPVVMGAVEARRSIKRQNLRTAFVQQLSSKPKKLPAIRLPKRSIAVLPFDTLGHARGNTYFADGVQDEILSNLAKVSQLKVISRTSVMRFRPGDNRNLRSIAESLGVANVVEGTVRRDGKRVRLTIRLVDARTDETLWSDSYDRNLTDIFAIQSEIAQTVAYKLLAQLSPEERKDIEEKPTNNLEAYDLYLQGKQLLNSVASLGSMKENWSKAISLLEKATQKDPEFALAYCLTAKAHDYLYYALADHTAERRALGDAAVNEALRLRPDLSEVHLAEASHLYFCYRDFERARVQLAIAAQALPNNPDLLQLTASIDQVQGRWEKATTGLERAATLDPRNPDILSDLAVNYERIRRYRDSQGPLDRLIELEPNQPTIRLRKALCAFFWKADLRGARAAYEAAAPSIEDDVEVTWGRVYLAMCARDFAAAEEILSKSPNEEIFLFYGALVPRQIWVLWLELIKGNHPNIEQFGAAREQLYQKVKADPADPMLLAALALADVALGRREESIQEGRHAMEMRPISEDAVDGPMIAMFFALISAWANDLDLAFEQLNIVIRLPTYLLHYGDLKTSPCWDPLRKDPRFEKLLVRLAPNQSLPKPPFGASRAGTRRPWARSAMKISIARLPVTGIELFGREEDIAFLDDAWANQQVNVVTIVAWAGVGKSTLINHWLRRMAAEHYRSAQLVFGWSFYRQGTSGGTSSADEFIDAALAWFGDPDPRLGTAWEKGERLAKRISGRRTLMVLDGLEPLQNPPGPQEGRVREPSLQALLRELAAFNKGLCVITTRTPVADIADHERTSALRRDLDQLSSDAGAKLLRALGVKGDEPELLSASKEFSGHCLALTLLGSYLTDAYGGDIRRRKEVSEHLADDVRQGVHARKVMESYQTWFAESPELSVLRMLGLFDRPAEEKALETLLKPPAIKGLTESFIDLNPTAWRTIVARLRRARLLAEEDAHNRGSLDTHPLVREYFGEQLRSQQKDAWKECNRRLYNYYRALAPRLPDSVREMEPLFLAVICGCNAGLYHEALHEVYIPRIQRGNASFAANVLGARGAVLSALAHFFENGRWGSPAEMAVEGQSLSPEDHLYILMQAALYLTVTRGFAAPEARTCYEHVDSLAHSLNRPLLLYSALTSQWRYSLWTGKLSAAMQIAERVCSLAQEQDDARLMMGAYRVLASTLYFLGDFETSRQYALRGLEIWRSGDVQRQVEEVSAPAVNCLCFKALAEWHIGETESCKATMAEAFPLAKDLNDMPALAVALFFAAHLAQFEGNCAEVERLALNLVELSTRQNFASWLPIGAILRGWARSASGDTDEGIAWIENGIADCQAKESLLLVPYWFALKAEALHFADRTSEALDAIRKAETLVETSEARWWCAELHRLGSVFLAAMGADEAQIEASFCTAIRTAKEQKSVSLEKRAEATYAEYRRQKTSAPGGHGFRLPL